MLQPPHDGSLWGKAAKKWFEFDLALLIRGQGNGEGLDSV